MKQQRNELQEKLEAEMAKHEDTYKTLRQMRQSTASPRDAGCKGGRRTVRGPRRHSEVPRHSFHGTTSDTSSRVAIVAFTFDAKARF